MKDCAVVILAAGKSERMGTPKAFLLYDEGKNITFIDKIIAEYQKFGCAEIIVVFNEANVGLIRNNGTNKVIVAINPAPELGRFYSLQIGISKVQKSNFIFVQNCDNPFVNQEILMKLFENRKKNAYISPVYNNRGGHPIIISREIFTKILTEMSKNQNLKTFLQPFERKNVFINESKILANINTQDEYNKYFKINTKN